MQRQRRGRLQAEGALARLDSCLGANLVQRALTSYDRPLNRACVTILQEGRTRRSKRRNMDRSFPDNHAGPETSPQTTLAVEWRAHRLSRVVPVTCTRRAI